MEKSKPKSSTPKPISKQTGATTMDELFRSTNTQVVPFVRGTKVHAKIVAVSRREIVADIGAKSYGIIIGREFDNIAHLVSTIAVGDEYEAEVIIPGMEAGETLISLRKALSERLWLELATIKKENRTLVVTGERPMSGGLLVLYKTLRGFIPQQQLDSSTAESLEKLIGAKLEVKILEIDRSQNRLVLSEREVSQKEALSEIRKALKAYKVGDTVNAKVTGMDKYVVMLKVEGKKKQAPVEGIIHISEVSWERVDKLSDIFSQGDTVEAKVIGINEPDACLSLSVKQLSKDPWTDIDKRFKKDQQIKGKIVRNTNLGIFIELEKGVEGLLHISKLTPETEYVIGEKISVTIDTIDTEKRKISLSAVATAKPIGYR